MEITLEGNLQHFRLGEILPFLGTSGKKGSLKVVSGGKERQIFFDAGAIVAAEANPAEGLSGQEIVFEAFGWEKGTFAFVEAASAPASAPAFKLDPKKAAEEAMRWSEGKNRPAGKLPDLSVIFKVADDPSKRKIELDAQQWKLLFRMNGKRTLGEVLEDAGGSSEQTLAMIQSLFENKLIEKVEIKPETAPYAQAESPSPASDLDQAGSASLKAAASKAEIPKAETPKAETPRREGSKKEASKTEQPPIAPSKPAPVAGPANEATTMQSLSEITSPAEEEDLSDIMAALTMDGEQKESFPLILDEHTVGRDPKNDIQIGDSSVSSAHARILRTPEGYVIEDLKSRNGTFVNDEKVERKVLKDNDSIRLGRIYLTYNIAQRLKVSAATLYEVPRP